MTRITALAFLLGVVFVLTAESPAARPRARRERRGAEVAVPEGVRNEAMVYKKIGGVELKLHVSFPKGWKASDKRPGIVFFFGGGWTGGTPGQFESQAVYLASRGMVAARADYRVKSRHGVTPVQCVEDARSAMRYVRANAGKLGIDPQRLCASGGSAGGHLAICTYVAEGVDAAADAREVSPKPNLLVLYNPVLDMIALASRVGDAKQAARISPNQRLTKDVPPAILYYGATDRFLEQAKAYLAKAGELGLKAEVHVAPGVGHAFFNRSPWQARTTYLTDRFLAKHGYLKGEPTVELPEKKVGMTKLDVRPAKP